MLFQKLGDADGDCDVLILDATVIQRKIESIPVAYFDDVAADVDGDGEVTILDATFIQRFLTRLSCPAGICKAIQQTSNSD